jgi:putative PIN family toxin of toxin-antitoxin system
MDVVADTNVIISGLLWQGAPRQVLDAAREGQLRLHTSAALLAELQDVLHRPKLSRRLQVAGVAAEELVLDYAALATTTSSVPIDPVIAADPDDDAVLACAAAAQAQAVVSGDSHLLDLREYQGIPILTAAELLARIPSASLSAEPGTPPAAGDGPASE